MKKKKSISLKNITKMDYARNRGYWVRFIRIIDGKQVMIDQKSFPKSKYGTFKKTLEEAIKYRDKVEKRLRGTIYDRRLRVDHHKNSKTKKLGVCRITETKRNRYGKVRKYSCWVACGNIIEKSQLKIRFYENVYGKIRAERLAIEARKWIEKMIKIENEKE